MLNKKRKNVFGRVFSVATAAFVMSSSSIVYADTNVGTNNIKVEYVSEVSPDEYIVPLSEKTDLQERSSIAANEEPLPIISNIFVGDSFKASEEKGKSQIGQPENVPLEDELQGFEPKDNESNYEMTVEYVEVTEMEIDSGSNVDSSVDDFSLGADAAMLAAALPDLGILSISPYGTYPFTALGSASIEIVVVNKNTGTAAASTNGIFVDGKYVGTFNSPSLQYGYGATARIGLQNIPAGNHIIEVRVDYYSVVAESDETNNIGSVLFSWNGTPDLIVQSFSPSSTSPIVGTQTSFVCVIANVGNADANAVFYTDILVNGSNLGSFTIAGLEARQTIEAGFDISFSTKGTYTIQLKTDSKGHITESNEQNNTASLVIQPKISPTVTVKGTIQYDSYERIGGSPTRQNLSNYTVKIYDENPIGSSLLATTTTDYLGKFLVTVNNATDILENGSDIYIVIEMENSYVMICKPDSAGLSYQFKSSTFEDYQQPVLEISSMVLNASETMKGAFNIYHWIKVAKIGYQSKAGTLGKVDVIWGPNASEGSNFDDSIIYINGNLNNQYSPSVITHEYGHYIMQYNNVNPNNAGGKHFLHKPAVNTGTAYSEAYAHFIATQLRNTPIYEDYSTASNYIRADFSDLSYAGKNSNEEWDSVVSRRPEFHENAKMELFTGGAMYSFAQSFGFNDINSAVMSKKSNDSIEFYNQYMNKTSSSNKIAVWEKFNQNHSAFDYALPEVTITGYKETGFRANATDDVGIARYEWYLDGTKVKEGDAYTPPTNLSGGVHDLQVRVYDYEGKQRKDEMQTDAYDRKDITGNTILRTKNYTTKAINFSVASSAQMHMENGFASKPNIGFDSFSELPKQDFISEKTFNFANPKQAGKMERNVATTNNLTIQENTDLYFVGSIKGAVESINIINKDNEIVDSIDGVYSDEFTVMRNLPAGEYMLEINTVSDIEQIPYHVNVLAVPSVPELDLPKQGTSEAVVQIDNPYSNQLNVNVNGKEFIVQPLGSEMIHLDEGENVLNYYTQNTYGKSETIEKTLVCDSVAPEVNILKATYNGKSLAVTGQISEYVDHLIVNGEKINLGEFNITGEPITFDCFINDSKVTDLAIEAIDSFGNKFESNVGISW